MNYQGGFSVDLPSDKEAIVWNGPSGSVPASSSASRSFGMTVAEALLNPDEVDPYPNLQSVPPGKTQFAVICDAHAGGEDVVARVTKDGRLVTAVGSVSWVRPGSDLVLAPCSRCVGASAVRSLSVLAVKELRREGAGRIRSDDVLTPLAKGSLPS